MYLLSDDSDKTRFTIQTLVTVVKKNFCNNFQNFSKPWPSALMGFKIFGEGNF